MNKTIFFLLVFLFPVIFVPVIYGYQIDVTHGRVNGQGDYSPKSYEPTGETAAINVNNIIASITVDYTYAGATEDIYGNWTPTWWQEISNIDIDPANASLNFEVQYDDSDPVFNSDVWLNVSGELESYFTISSESPFDLSNTYSDGMINSSLSYSLPISNTSAEEEEITLTTTHDTESDSQVETFWLPLPPEYQEANFSIELDAILNTFELNFRDIIPQNPFFSDYDVDTWILDNRLIHDSVTLDLYASGSWAIELFEYEPPAPNPVPEPCTMILFGTGMVGLLAIRRNKE